MGLDAEHPAIFLDLVLKPFRLSICAARNCESLTEDGRRIWGRILNINYSSVSPQPGTT